MNITISSDIGDSDITFNDLDIGDVFISYSRDCVDLIPSVFMKAADETEGNTKYYVVDLQTGEIYSDVNNYPIDKIIEDEFEIEV